MILSVGYRVKSDHDIKFCVWATGVLRDFLLKGHTTNQRLKHIERRLCDVEEKVDFFVNALPPVEGIFYAWRIGRGFSCSEIPNNCL
jgi:hypothetical protein